MATRFELVLHGDNDPALRAAGEEALDEIDRLESQLSLYRAGSEIARVNVSAAREPVRVTPDVFALLQQARKLSEQTGGAFDITIAPLVRCWGFMGGSGKQPSPEELAAARAVVGMNLVQMDERNLTIQFARDGVMLDLGAIGKGYAVERAANLLRDAGVTSALIHGGTSTVHAIGQQPSGEKWKIAIEMPSDNVWSSAFRRLMATPPPKGGTPNLLATISLKDESLSVSAVWGKSFQADGKTFGHVLDPRSGQPVSSALLAVVVLPSATETDALSTALLTLGSSGFEQISTLRPKMRTLLVARDGDESRVESRGIAMPRGNNLPVEKQTSRG